MLLLRPHMGYVGATHGTFGSLTFRVGVAKLGVRWWQKFRSPRGMAASKLARGVAAMKFAHLCYVAFGFAVARWFFKREPVPVADPVARFRTSGLL